MRKRGGKLAGVLMALSLGAWLAAQEVPDAPSATKRPEPEKQASPLPPPSEGPAAKPIPRPETPPPEPANPQPPPMVMSTTPAGSQAEGTAGSREEMFKLSVTLNFVIVPVTVKDGSDRLVDGLLRKDFTVYEDGVLQPLKLFTSDPFPLSAAVVLDLGMPDVVMRKVNETLPSLVGAFSAYDEVSLYTFASSVEQRLDYSVVDAKFSAALKRERRPGRQGGVPVTSGPMAAGPSVNGVPFDPGAPHVRSTLRRESKVMNDAILAAALDLARRDRNRRKILFVISDGSEYGSRASYGEVLKVLLSNEISVYAINVDASALPGVRTLEGIHIPRMGYGNILPRYASATGGQIFREFDQDAIEQAYARVTEVARNQYTLGYTTRANAANTYRSIEVKVRRGGLRVFAKDGYYPLPPTR